MVDSPPPPYSYTPKPHVAAKLSRAILLSVIFMMVYNFVVFCRQLLVLGSLAIMCSIVPELIEAQFDCVHNEGGLNCGPRFSQVYQSGLQLNSIEKPLFYFNWLPDIRDGVALIITYLGMKVLLY
ncbi:hypothetical protein C8J55DRAFT_487588 [Lentinula edodes]|uniref:Uncharacterized protein n=1 Tax=Lentinula lateritia TaxID=40482 RepID=A0A9W9AP63_9AGAR|nr:hypothetical protein C8J55DRAFT_487588 [Lentinula edodes]